jgi:hypothetical protein
MFYNFNDFNALWRVILRESAVMIMSLLSTSAQFAWCRNSGDICNLCSVAYHCHWVLKYRLFTAFTVV